VCAGIGPPPSGRRRRANRKARTAASAPPTSPLSEHASAGTRRGRIRVGSPRSRKRGWLEDVERPWSPAEPVAGPRQQRHGNQVAWSGARTRCSAVVQLTRETDACPALRGAGLLTSTGVVHPLRQRGGSGRPPRAARGSGGLHRRRRPARDDAAAHDVRAPVERWKRVVTGDCRCGSAPTVRLPPSACIPGTQVPVR
jgi:hypothetical protein